MKAADNARLFLALWPDDGMRAALVRCRDAWAWDADASPQPTERLHLTLHFLGAVPRQHLPELTDGLKVPCKQFTLRLDQAQCWPSGVAVLTPMAAPPVLLALHEALRDRIERLGLRVESRSLRPHVTLARHAANSVAPAQASPVDWPVSGYVLVESQSVTGDYVVLWRHGCAAAASS
jgi:2'-5' RNA ligase